LKNQTSGLTYQATSLDFSCVFREHVAEHKNLWGILKNQTPASMGIPISSISFSEMLVICPRDTLWEPFRYSPKIMKFLFEKNLTPVYTSDFFSCCTKSDDQPPEDLAKSGYKSNRQVEKSKNITGFW
jgi:hypothetical protein